ncbi:MAG: hypothetical protein ACPGYV_09360 [Phycisphaeraceae bacterium]
MTERCLVAALSAVMLVTLFMASPADAARREDPLAGLTRDQRRVFQNYTRVFCQQFFRYDDDRFVLLPNYYRERENSTGKTYDQAFEEMTEIEVVKTRLITKEIRHEPPVPEVIIASKVIPAIDVGHYGFVNSVVVKEVIGPKEMIVSKLELIPPNEVGRENNALRRAAADRQREYAYSTYRMLGFSTKDLKPGDQYYGPRKKGLQVAVMSTDKEHNFVLVDYDRLSRVRTSDFAEALAYVKISPLEFLDMVRSNREQLTTDGDKATLISIYRLYYNRYRPKRVSDAPSVAEPEPDVTRPRPEPKPDSDEPSDDKPDLIDVSPSDPSDRPKSPPRTEPEARPDPPRSDPPRREPKREVEEEDDWTPEDSEDAPDKPTFFGIPL